jgi:hypothetical protein
MWNWTESKAVSNTCEGTPPNAGLMPLKWFSSGFKRARLQKTQPSENILGLHISHGFYKEAAKIWRR